MSVDYSRLSRLETQLANNVLQKILVNIVYLPPDIVYGCHVFFAVDNGDFQKDTDDGKRTLHATTTASVH